MSEFPNSQFNQIPINKIERSDISREMPGVGETEIIAQRHEKYIRDLDHERSGSLEPGEAKKSYDQAMEILEVKLSGLSEEERKDVDILVIASNTEYGRKEKHRGMRSFETGSEVVNGVLSVLEKQGLNKSQLLNSRTTASQKAERVVPSKNKTIQEPRMFEQSPEFKEFLESKYGNQTQKFWQAFEEDWEAKTRKEMEAEGPDEMAKRYYEFMNVLKNFSQIYHKKHHGKRLIIWPVSHYDTITQFVKREILKQDAKKTYLPVDYGAGVSVKIDQEGNATSRIQGQEFPVIIEKRKD